MNIHCVIPLLQVFDMPRSIEFYCDTLGCCIVSTSNSDETATSDEFYWAMLRLGEATIMLNTAYEEDERPASPDATRVAAHADTILYFACDSADDVYDYLCEKGCSPQPPMTTHYGMRQVYVNDPDGYELCFQHAVNV